MEGIRLDDALLAVFEEELVPTPVVQPTYNLEDIPLVTDPRDLKVVFEKLLNHDWEKLVAVFSDPKQIDPDHKRHSQGGNLKARRFVKFTIPLIKVPETFLTFYELEKGIRVPLCRVPAKTVSHFQDQAYVIETVNISTPFKNWDTFGITACRTGFRTETVGEKIAVIAGNWRTDPPLTEDAKLLIEGMKAVAGESTKQIFYTEQKEVKRPRLTLQDIFEKVRTGGELYDLGSFKLDLAACSEDAGDDPLVRLAKKLKEGPPI